MGWDFMNFLWIKSMFTEWFKIFQHVGLYNPTHLQKYSVEITKTTMLMYKSHEVFALAMVLHTTQVLLTLTNPAPLCFSICHFRLF